MMFAIVCLFIILGIILSLGHGANLIAGYNTLPKEQKERYDTRSMGRFMGRIMFTLAALCSLWRWQNRSLVLRYFSRPALI